MPANSVAMVLPTDFASNAESAIDNQFMSTNLSNIGVATEEVPVCKVAVAESLALCRALGQAGVNVQMFPSPAQRVCPDAVFPNNWFSTHILHHPDNSMEENRLPERLLVLYPMKWPSRRNERDGELLAELKARATRVLDLTHWEKEGVYLEGTGSMILDHAAKIIYACRSERTHEEIVGVVAKELGGWGTCVFDAVDESGNAMYHTNVIMAVGVCHVVACVECIPTEMDKQKFLSSVRNSGKELIEITLSQVRSFCGNVLQVSSNEGKHMWVMSTCAFHAFTDEQKKQMGPIVHAAVPTIERVGGGGVRCMLGELHWR
eukprot:ANDGO_06024.mRNA.1 hypothetical protein